jgi:cytochrome P450
MILNEVHRLFPILPQLTRVASKDMQLGNIFVPKGLVLEILVFHMHHDPKIWGENVMEFDPNRFANGVSKACQHQQSFIPFAFGPRNCLGQNFSLLESKVVIATVLSRFQLSVSPSYKHCPHNPFLHSPKFGVQLIIKSLTPSPMP